jgi:hypothetical protein
VNRKSHQKDFPVSKFEKSGFISCYCKQVSKMSKLVAKKPSVFGRISLRKPKLIKMVRLIILMIKSRLPSQQWKQVYLQAFSELHRDSLWNGKSEDIFWFAFDKKIVVLQNLNAECRHRKISIEFSDVFELKCLEALSHSVSIETIDVESLCFTETSFSAHNSPCFLYVQYKDPIHDGISVLFLPSWTFGAKEFEKLRHKWLILRTNSLLIEQERFQVLWQGLHFDDGKHVGWCLTRKCLSICNSLDLFCLHIPLFDIYELELQDGKNLLVSFTRFEGETAESFADEVVCLRDFGTEHDFEDLSLLWRQEHQLKLIEFCLNKSLDADLALFSHALQKRDSMRELNASSSYLPSLTASSTSLNNDGLSARPRARQIKLRRAESVSVYLGSETMKRQSNLKRYSTSLEYKLSNQEESLHDAIFKELENQLNSLKLEQTQNKKETLPRRRYTEHSIMSTSRTLQRSKSDEFLQSRNSFRAENPALTIFSALYDYQASGAGEMSFRSGDLLKIIKKDESGWWFGLLLKYEQGDSVGSWNVCAEGWVPSNFLQCFTK